MLLDALTIFFLVAGSLLLWLNIRRHPNDVILTKLEDGGRWSIAGPSLEEVARKVAAKKAPQISGIWMVTWLPITAYAPRLAESRGSPGERCRSSRIRKAPLVL